VPVAANYAGMVRRTSGREHAQVEQRAAGRHAALPGQ
jgi:hypothetical protein